MTITKSPGLRPAVETLRQCLGWYGTLSGENSAGLPSLPTYARKNDQSPVWRGHSQLSISPP